MNQFIRCSFILGSVSALVSCASLYRSDEEPKEVIAPEKSLAQILPTKNTSGLKDYKFKGKPFKAGWTSCSLENSTGTVVLMHRDEAGFDPTKVCSGWMAQVFAREGFDVIAINRPGYVNSTGSKDFGGPHSLAAVLAGVAAASQHVKTPVVGVWGYSSGAIAASFFAKEVKNLQWAILGGGIFDLEAQAKNQKSKFIATAIETALKIEGEVAYETRSISYDFAGLPKRLALYHGKNNVEVEISQSISFRDSLRSQEYRVTLEELDNTGHDIPWMNHYQILQTLVRSVK